MAASLAMRTRYSSMSPLRSMSRDVVWLSSRTFCSACRCICRSTSAAPGKLPRMSKRWVSRAMSRCELLVGDVDAEPIRLGEPGLEIDELLELGAGIEEVGSVVDPRNQRLLQAKISLNVLPQLVVELLRQVPLALVDVFDELDAERLDVGVGGPPLSLSFSMSSR